MYVAMNVITKHVCHQAILVIIYIGNKIIIVLDTSFIRPSAIGSFLDLYTMLLVLLYPVLQYLITYIFKLSISLHIDCCLPLNGTDLYTNSSIIHRRGQ